MTSKGSSLELRDLPVKTFLMAYSASVIGFLGYLHMALTFFKIPVPFLHLRHQISCFLKYAFYLGNLSVTHLSPLMDIFLILIFMCTGVLSHS